jgi:NADH-quinone oxidoreductase subunit J
MLTSKISGKALVVEHTNRWSGLLVGAAFFALLLYLFYQHTFPVPGEPERLTQQSLQRIGTGIMTDYILPFELAGILLLAALIGAAVLAGTLKPKSNDVSS